jgi:hypothetical protein
MSVTSETATTYDVTFVGDYFRLTTTVDVEPDQDPEDIAKEQLSWALGWRLDYEDTLGHLRQLHEAVLIKRVD